jgi:hypothetical protein
MANEYDGPKEGQTPSDQDELHGNGDNPYSQGSQVDDTRTSVYQAFGSIAEAPGNPGVTGYYFNPPVDPVNPYSGGLGVGAANFRADQDASTYVGDGMADLFADIFANRQPNESGESSANASAINDDSGYGPNGNGRS